LFWPFQKTVPHNHPELEEKRVDLYSITEAEEYPVWSRSSAAYPEFYERRGVQLLGRIAEWSLPNDEELAKLAKMVTDKEDDGVPTFEKDQGKEGFRRQLVLAKNSLVRVSGEANGLGPLTRVHEGVLSVLPRSITKFDFLITLLHSPAGSADIQLPHRDLDIITDDSGKVVRALQPEETFLLLVALQDNTTLLVYFGSHIPNNRIKVPHRVSLSRGEVLRFHPQLIHSGDRYTVANTRVHYYVMPVGFTLMDETHFPEPKEVAVLGDQSHIKVLEGDKEKRRANQAAKAAKKSETNAKLAANAAVGRAKKAAKRLASSTDVPPRSIPAAEEYDEEVSDASAIEEAPPVQESESQTPPVAEEEVATTITDPSTGVNVVEDEEDIRVIYAEEGPGWGWDESYWALPSHHSHFTRSKRMRLE